MLSSISKFKNNSIDINQFSSVYKLDNQQTDKIKNLTKMVLLENLDALLRKDYFSDQADKQALLNTFYKVSDQFSAGISSKDIYVGRSKIEGDESFSFYMTSNGQLIIGLDEMASGKFKKVNVAASPTRPVNGLVKIAVRGKRAVEKVRGEIDLRRKFYKSQMPYIIPPAEISIETQCKDKDSKGNVRKAEDKSKYVYFEQQMDDDGLIIDPKDIKKAAQLFHDFAKGLSYLHKFEEGYVHSDAKLDNILIRNNRAFISDFGLTIKKGESYRGGSLAYVPPECLEKSENDELEPSNSSPDGDPSYDSFSLGFSILTLFNSDIDEHLEENYGHWHLGFLTDQKRVEFFRDFKAQAMKNEDKLSDDKLVIKMKLIELAEALTVKEPSKRLSCAKVAEELAKIPEIITSDPIL